MKPDQLFQGSFKSSLRKKRRASIKRKKAKEENRPFIIKPIPSPLLKPLIVFINPKSGGNQGAKLMHKFCWWLNPRQVFDLSHGGPRAGYVMQNMEGKKKFNFNDHLKKVSWLKNYFLIIHCAFFTALSCLDSHLNDC